MKLTTVLALITVLVLVGCGSANHESTSMENEPPSAAPTSSVVPTSTLPRVETSVGNGVAVGDQQSDLQSAGWLLVSGSVDEQSIPTEPDLVMDFGETILFFPLSCNSGSVHYHIDGTSIDFDFDYFTKTEMRCAPDLTYPPEVQARLFEIALRRVETVTMREDRQEFEFEGPGVTMEFARIEYPIDTP